MLDSAQKDRIKTMAHYACTAPTNLHTHQVSTNSHTPQGSGHSIDESEIGYLNGEPDNNHSNGNGVNTPILCPPCNIHGLLLKHLKTCPEPQVSLPYEIKDLSPHYRDIEDSISTIRNTIQDISTDTLLTEVKN